MRRSAQLFQAMAVTFLVCYFVYFVGLALRAAHTASDPFLFIVVKPVIDVLCYFNLMYLSSPPFIFFAASRRLVGKGRLLLISSGGYFLVPHLARFLSIITETHLTAINNFPLNFS